MKHTLSILTVILLFASTNLAMQEHDNAKKPSLFSYFSHPASVVGTSILSFGGYCLYDKQATAHAFEWLKERFDEVPSVVKFGSALVGCLGLYTYFYYGKKGSTKEVVQSINSRVSRIEDNDKIMLETFGQGHEHVLIPRITFMKLCRKMSNVEIILLGNETNEQSFGPDAPLQKNMLDITRETLEKRLGFLEEAQEAFEHHLDLLEEQQNLLSKRLNLPPEDFKKRLVALENNIRKINDGIIPRSREVKAKKSNPITLISPRRQLPSSPPGEKEN